MNPEYNSYNTTMPPIGPGWSETDRMGTFEQRKPGRPRCACGLLPPLIIIAASALALGHTLRRKTEPDGSQRHLAAWCTVWSLLERGNYVIDECPWQKPDAGQGVPCSQGRDRHAEERRRTGPTLLLEQARVITDVDCRDSLPGVRLATTGVPSRPSRAPRSHAHSVDPHKPDPDSVYGVKGYWRRPKIPCVGPFTSSHFKPIVVLLNVIPFGILLVLYARGARPPRGQRVGLAVCLVAAAFRDVSLAVYANA